MGLQLSFRGDARAECDESFDWYEQQSPGLGARFVQAVQDRLDEVVANPKRYPVVHRDVREAMVVGFPFCVYYVIQPARIRILSVFHTPRDPSIWMRRRNTP